MKPPVAPKVPHSTEAHGVRREDPYAWLRDPDYPKVEDPRIRKHLEAENAYFDARMAPHSTLVDTLFAEIKGRQPREDVSVPYREGSYWYRWRYEKDAQYRLWERAPLAQPAQWQVMLNEPALAAEHSYFSLGGFTVSPDGRYLAWSADTSGSERYVLRVTDLETNTPLGDVLEPTLGAPVWSRDGHHLLYLKVNASWRPYQVLRHRLGAAVETDTLIYEEADEGYFVGIDETQSEQWLVISTGDHVTSEAYLLPSDDVLRAPELIAPRRPGHEYHLDHREGYFYIRSNADHANFSLLRAPEATPDPDHWEVLIPGSDQRYLTDHLCLKHHLVVCERVNGLDNIRVFAGDSGDGHDIVFPEQVYSVDFGANAEYDSPALRLIYESMVTPLTVFDYHIDRQTLEHRKTQEVPSGYDRAAYHTERILAPGRDGVKIPVSLVYRTDLRLDGSPPLYLYGYGAYGHAIAPGFSASRLSLLDRGFVFAIAHVRGGDDLGYSWYADGKLDKRINTFNDFVDVARYLASGRYTSPGRIAAVGGSAGGELVAAATNQAPELFGAVVAHVPFVDVLTTMLDASLPLTPIEWPEWGNPGADKIAFDYILSYSPYDQLAARDYPAMLVTAGLNDPRVTYWEPAKYVARLRELKTDDQWLLLKTNMDAGHSGQSGRFDALREVAEEYAFVLVSLGLKDEPATGVASKGIS